MDHTLADLRDLAIRLAQAAGAELLRRADDVHEVDAKSSATDPVSEADRASEALLVEGLRAARPDDALLGEEGADREGSSGLRWVLDPLDGTVNYLYGRRAWSVSIACEDADGALVGVVHDPSAQETFHALRGQGAWRDRERLRVNDPVELERALVATGFSYSSDQRAAQGDMVARLLPQVRDVRRAGSCALDLCAVAAGRADAYYEAGVRHWDWAAGALIAAEAGAVVTRPTLTCGRRGLIAAGPHLQPALRALLT